MHKWWRGLLSNWPWKLTALLVACFVFYSIRRTVSYTQTLSLTVEAETIRGGDVALMNFSPSTVKVLFRGPEAAIRRLSDTGLSPPRVRVKLQPPADGTTTAPVYLHRSDVMCDSQLRVVSIEPTELVATFDAPQTRPFPIDDPEIVNAPQDSKVVVSIEPKTVQLTGSSVLLDRMEDQGISLKTASLDLANRTQSFEAALHVLPPSNDGSWSLDPMTVRATVRFLKDDTQKTIPAVPVHILQAPSGTRYKTDTQTVKVTLYGDRHDLSAINDRYVEVLVSEPEKPQPDEQGRIMCEPQVLLPCTNRVDRVEINPPRLWIAPEVTPAKEDTKSETTLLKEAVKAVSTRVKGDDAKAESKGNTK